MIGEVCGKEGGRKELRSEFWWEKTEGQTNLEHLEIEVNYNR